MTLLCGDRRPARQPLGLACLILLLVVGCGRPQGGQDTATDPAPSAPGTPPTPGVSVGQGLTPIDPPRSSVLSSQRAGAQINIRSTPSTTAPVVAQGQSGQGVQLLSLTEAEDGYTWYQVRLAPSDQEGWVRGDLVSQAGAVAATPPQPSCEGDRQQALFETQSFTVYICQGPRGLRYVSIDKTQQAIIVSQEVIRNHDIYIAIDGDHQYHLSDQSLGVYRVNNGNYSQLMAETVVRSEKLVY
jgi:hypothetical protein